MNTLERIRLVVVAVLSLHDPSRADVIDIDWGSQQRFERSVPIAPGRFAELCGKLPAGTTVSWQFESAEPLDFNIHYHEGKAVHYPEKRSATARAEGRLRVTLDQDYCWMWTNKSPRPATLTTRLSR